MASASASDSPIAFKSIRYEVDRAARVATISLHRPERFNAIDEHIPGELKLAIALANTDPGVTVIVLTGAGKSFCSGYDLTVYAESGRGHPCSQPMPWDPYVDFAFISSATTCYMAIWNSFKPVIAKIRGYAVGGGSDIALCCDLVVMAEDAKIGYPPVRVWGCPTTAMWVYRVGMVKAKQLLLTGDLVDGKEALRIGLINSCVPDRDLDREVARLAARIASVPVNQLFFQKRVINQAVELQGLHASQTLSSLFDGITRHSPEGIAFQQKCVDVGFHAAVKDRDAGVPIVLPKEQQERNDYYHSLLRSKITSRL